MSIRSSTPTFSSRRPGLPSIHSSSSIITHSTPNLQTIPSSSSTVALTSSSPSPQQSLYTGYIKVSVRVKPPTANKSGSITKVEVSPDGTISTINNQWTVDTNRNAITSKEIGDFVFDNVYHGSILNSHVFDNSVRELVDQVMAGYNGTVFAYGMTGSGKTYSMQGDSANPGIIPLSVNAIFNYANSPSNTEDNRLFTIKVAYLEIYNEHLNDLLSPSTPSEDIKLRDDPVRGVRALGLKEIVVNSPEKLLEYIQAGDALRRTEGTEFNSKSSRSHAVVQITVESTSNSQPGMRTSTLYLCDLAGSERAASKTERRKEGAYINKSLLTLGTVIARLCAASTGSGSSAGHIPYRDSKLTRLLQPALSGKSLVSVLCTIDVNTGAGVGGASGTGTGNITSSNSTNSTYLETISTLRFAARAKNIIVSVKRNEESGDSTRIIEKLMFQLEAQKIEIAKLKAANKTTEKLSSISISKNGIPIEPDSDSSVQYLTQIVQLEAENKILHERVEHLTRLCDDTKLEEMIFGSENSEGNNPNYDTDLPSSTSSCFPNFDDDNPGRKQISEYKSYISHLEKQLYLAEVQKATSSGPQTLFLNQNDSSTNVAFSNQNSMSGMPLPTSLPHPPVPSTPSRNSNDQTFYYNETIQDLKEEIEELQESNTDKDRIIAALRSINRRKENLNVLSINRGLESGNNNNSGPNSGNYNNSGSEYGNLFLLNHSSSSNLLSPSSVSGLLTSNIPKPSAATIRTKTSTSNFISDSKLSQNFQSVPRTPIITSPSNDSTSSTVMTGSGPSPSSLVANYNSGVPSFDARPVSNGSSPVRAFSLQESVGRNRNLLNSIIVEADSEFGGPISLPPPPAFLPSSSIPSMNNSENKNKTAQIQRRESIERFKNLNKKYPNLLSKNINIDLDLFEESFVNDNGDNGINLESPTSIKPDYNFNSILNIKNNKSDLYSSNVSLPIFGNDENAENNGIGKGKDIHQTEHVILANHKNNSKGSTHSEENDEINLTSETIVLPNNMSVDGGDMRLANVPIN